ncbi:hypothetical protein ORV05_08970 [Amycolatopsis cynarae]|uniref:non-specific serine/threonine protein kinase n=1 Tax=Amycolatopsis cynarae TaxID=2995223 RepID=A0ABY7BBC7_9PSEU|nr:hypothetical protein [Amycolatopsis sp. HUAS 11-8]WAL69656.1 hypothetical protein ORV05_08970 [Amycolatopsis sp. HUAS 11-8]
MSGSARPRERRTDGEPAGRPAGSAGFASPEQVEDGEPDPSSDVFSLGCVLAAACTGNSPFAGSSTVRTLYNIVQGEPDLGALPARLRPIVEACLAKNPAGRPGPAQVLEAVGAPAPTARPWPPAVHQMIDAQHAQLAGLAGTPPKPGGPRTAWAPVGYGQAGQPGTGPADWSSWAPPVAPQPIPPQPIGPPKARGRRRAMWYGIPAVLCVVLAVVAAVVFWPDNSAQPRFPPRAVPNGKGGFLWAVTTDGNKTGEFVGMWSTPTTVVLGTDHEMTAYDIATGAAVWTWKPPEADGSPLLCGMSNTTSDGVGAFTYGVFGKDSVDHCDHLQVMSVATGKLGWAQPVSLVGAGATRWPRQGGSQSLSIGGGVVVAPYAGVNTHEPVTTDLIAVDAKTGRPQWSTDFGGGPQPGDSKACKLGGQAQVYQGRIYALALCTGISPTLDPEVMLIRNPQTLLVSDLLTGCRDSTPDWTLNDARFVLTGNDNYLLAACRSYRDQHYHVSVLASQNGRETAIGNPVDLTFTDTGILDPPAGGSTLPSNLVLGKDSFYLLRKGSSGDDGVVAFGPPSPWQKWNAEVAGASSVVLLGADDSGVVLMAAGMSGPALYTITGKDQVTKVSALNPEQVKAFSDATGDAVPRGVRIGDYVAIVFPGIRKNGETLLGVTRVR